MNKINYKRYIQSDFRIMLGKPIIKGTRITVEHILKKLAEGASVDDIIEMYPHISKKDIYAVLSYASEVISNESVLELKR